MKVDKRWTGRKLWLSILTAIFVILNAQFDWLTQTQINDVIKVIGYFIGFEGVADIVTRFRPLAEK